MKKVRLGDIVSYYKGYAFSSKLYQDYGKMVVRVTDFTADSISTNDAIYIKENKIYDKYKIYTGDILIQTVGSWANNPNSIVGKIVRVPETCNNTYLNQNIVKIVPNKNINRDYLYYALKANNFSNYCVMRGQGAANQASITLQTIFKFKFDCHSLKEQNKIARVLVNYDKLIERNNKRTEILEKMIQEIYKEWFVRFRFPGYENIDKTNGVPGNFKEIKIKELTSIKSGYAFKSEWFIDEGEPVAKIKDINGKIMDVSDFSYVSKENTKKAEKFQLKEGDLTIALTGATIGKLGIVPKYSKTIYTNQRLGKFFNGDEPINKLPFLYVLFSQDSIRQLILNISGASSAQPNISPEQIEDIKIISNIEIINLFNEKTKALFEEILKLWEKNQNLVKQRDLLLPRLISGKLKIN